MNAIGNMGDPQQVAAALKPLVDAAEDKALAQVQATVAVATAALHQEIAGLREDLATHVKTIVESLDHTVQTGIADAIGRLSNIASSFHPTITFGPVDKTVSDRLASLESIAHAPAALPIEEIQGRLTALERKGL